MFYVYVLESKKNGKHYIGHTQDLQKRISEYNSNRNRRQFTCVNGPWVLSFFEIFDTRADAMKYENFLKTGKGRECIKQELKSF